MGSVLWRSQPTSLLASCPSKTVTGTFGSVKVAMLHPERRHQRRRCALGTELTKRGAVELHCCSRHHSACLWRIRQRSALALFIVVLSLVGWQGAQG